MALARSASGPGGLSINTSSANSLFGSSSTSQPPASGGIFGSSKPSGGLFGTSTTATSAPQTQGLFGIPQTAAPSGGLFGSLTSSAAPQSGGLFGSVTSSTAPQSGGLFGSVPISAAPQTSGLFGSVASSTVQTGGPFGTTTTTSQPQQPSSLFGSLNTTTQPQQGGGLFGNMSTTTQPQSSGLFSSLGAQPAQNQGTTGGFFGASTQTQPAAQTGGLFGNLSDQNQNKPNLSFGSLGHPQASQPQVGSTFGSLNASRPAFGISTTGGLSMGQTQGQNQGQNPTQSIPGVRIDVTNIRGTTRFNELHEELQKEIENYDKGILIQQQRANDCSAIMPSHEEQLCYIPEGVEFLSRKIIGVETSLETDAESVAFVQNLVKSDIEDAKLSFKAIDNLKLPKQFHHPGIWSSKAPTLGPESQNPGAQDLVAFFSRTADEMGSKLSMYKSRIGEIEQHLRSVESATMTQAEQLIGNGMSADPGGQLRELGAVLREFEAGIIGVAGVVAKTQDSLEILKMGVFLTPEEDHKGQTARNGMRA